MQIVLDAAQMSKIDRTAIEDIGIPGVVLMENAGRGIVQAIENFLGDIAKKQIVFFCGKGNNGGDGYVVARHLHNRGAQVSVFLAGKKEKIKGDALINLKILEQMGITVKEIASTDQVSLPPRIDLVVDALLGTGVTGPVVGFFGELIRFMNDLGAPIISVDLPSGMETDTGAVHGDCVKAEMTVTMAHLKTGLLFSPARDFAGEVVIADISVPPEISERLKGNKFLVEADDVRSRLPKRKLDAHKTNCGTVVVFAGSVGMTGAATLTAISSLQAGAGLTKLGIPASLNPILEQKLTEVMTVPLAETNDQSISLTARDQIGELLDWAHVLAVGPGLSTHPDTVEFVKWLMTHVTKPMVLDADGINALSGAPEMIENYRSDLIITPHPGELARLIGTPIADILKDRLNAVRQLAQQWGKIIVLKGGPTVIAAPDGNLYINSTGNPGMATGGSGDVLTGIIAGLLAQKLSPLDAALVGVYLHGRAGDLAAEDLSQPGMIAGDISYYLPAAIKELE